MENEWLSRGEIWATVKAYRLYEGDVDIDDLNDMFEIVEKQFGTKNV